MYGRASTALAGVHRAIHMAVAQTGRFLAHAHARMSAARVHRIPTYVYPNTNEKALMRHYLLDSGQGVAGAPARVYAFITDVT